MTEQDREPEPESREERFEAEWNERQRFLRRTWKRGRIGKAFVIFYLVGLATPFFFDVVVIFGVWFFLWPRATSVTEQVAALAIIFAALHAIGLGVQRWAVQLWEFAYLMRPRRGRRKKTRSG